MGKPAGFEEKEFETLANASLMLRSRAKGATMPALFSPGQVLEREHGFDFSMYLDPASSTYRLLFGGFPGPAARVAARPPALPAGVPNINTFIQYKRPEYFTQNHRQSVWHRESFLRFSVRSRYTLRGQQYSDHSQLDALEGLAHHNPRAKVRYACPSAWTRPDLYAQYARDVLIANCSFTDPRNLSHRVGGVHAGWHDYWTFQPHNPARGRPNPEGPIRDAQNGEGFLEEVRRAVDNQSSREFSHSVFEIRSATKESRSQLAFFRSESGVSGRTKLQAIEEAKRSIGADFLGVPRDESWLRQTSRLDTERPYRHPLSDEMDVIVATVEVAATAKELGLTWMVAVG